MITKREEQKSTTNNQNCAAETKEDQQKKKKLPQREFPIMLVIRRPTGTINLNQWFKNRKNTNYQNCTTETEGKKQNKKLTSKKWHCRKVERERKYIGKNKSVGYWRVERMRRGKVGVTNHWETWEEWIDCWIKGKCLPFVFNGIEELRRKREKRGERVTRQLFL